MIYQKISALILCLLLALAPTANFGAGSSRHLSSSVKVTRQAAQQRARSGERLIIHRNSGTRRTAVCRDGSISLSKHRRGTCSHHGGVRRWL